MTTTLFDYPSSGGRRLPAGPVDEVAPSNPPDGAAASFVVLVTGSRHATGRHRPRIADVLFRVVEAHPWPPHVRYVLRHGGAPGVDTIAAEVAESRGWLVDPHPADWPNCGPDCLPRPHRKMGPYNAYCPLAGHRRNRHMVDLLPRPDVVIGLPDRDANPSRSGTWQCLHYAVRQGLHVASVDGLRIDKPAGRR